MWVDASHLYHFYNSRLGKLVKRSVSLCLKEFSSPVMPQDTVVSYGYGFPYLEQTLGKTNRTLFLMPSSLGAFSWPLGQKNLTCLCERDSIPLPTRSVHKLLITHALEFTRDIEGLLQEAWRVLVEGGELIIIAPNRRGIWARSVDTPFGCGHPYSGNQLFSLVEAQGLIPIENPTYCLFYPPFLSPLKSPKTLLRLEKTGRKWCKKLGGLVYIRAEKRVVATTSSQSSGLKARIFQTPSFANE
tara:strand:- start:1088 stop:1819 length:732 start_codon:yes stop_codon:yes gene_type:complete